MKIFIGITILFVLVITIYCIYKYFGTPKDSSSKKIPSNPILIDITPKDSDLFSMEYSIDPGYTGNIILPFEKLDNIYWSDNSSISSSSLTRQFSNYGGSPKLTVKVFKSDGQYNIVDTPSNEFITKIISFGNFSNDKISFKNFVRLQSVPNTLPSSITDTSNMFSGCKLFNSPLDGWDLSNVIHASSMFKDCELFNQNLSSWKLRLVANTSDMFSGCTSFNGDVSNFDLSNVTDTGNMFYNCISFNPADIGNWYLPNVINMKNMFGMCKNLTASNLDNWGSHLDSVEDVSYIFQGCINFDEPLTRWFITKDFPSTITNIQGMFYGCSNFNQDLGAWDVSNVKNMSSMFYGCSKFNRYISSWNITNVGDMDQMFFGCTNFNQDLSRWVPFLLKNRIDIRGLLSGCGSYPFNDSKLITHPENYNDTLYCNTYFKENALLFNNIDKRNMIFKSFIVRYNSIPNNYRLTCPFKNCKVISWGDGIIDSQELTHTYSNMTQKDYYVMFFNENGSYEFDYTVADFTYFANIISFGNCDTNTMIFTSFILKYRLPRNSSTGYYTLYNIYSAYWNNNVTVSWGDGTINSEHEHVYKFDNEFKDYIIMLTNKDDIYVRGVYPYKITDSKSPAYNITHVISFGNSKNTSFSFENCGSLISVPVRLPSSVTNLNKMFSMCVNFNSDISNWDVSRVTQMSRTFASCIKFDAGLSTWNVSNVINMEGIFYGNQVDRNISKWNVSNVTNMRSMFYMSSIIPDISRWNVSNVTNMSNMFMYCHNIIPDISNWDVSNVTDMNSMFFDCENFNQNLSSWNVSNVINMSSMFAECNSFNQNLSSWNVSLVTDMRSMFYNCTSFDQNLSVWFTKIPKTAKLNFMLCHTPSATYFSQSSIFGGSITACP